MRLWHEALQQHEGAEQDFMDDLGRLREKAQAAQDAALDWAGSREALGAKKVLDSLLSSLTRSKTEERNHARYRRDSQPAA